MISFIRSHKTETVIFIIALLARFAYFFVCLYANGGDIIQTIHGQDGYFQIGTNLALGNGFSGDMSPAHVPDPHRVPLYPYFLAALLYVSGMNYWFAGIVQLILGATIPLLAMKLLRQILPTYETIPIIVGGILAVEPYHVLFSYIFYTETLFLFVFYLFLIYFNKFLEHPLWKYALVTSALLGAATLIKPTTQYVPIVMAVCILWHFRAALSKNLFAKIFTICAVFVLILSPWIYRNYRVFGVAAISAQIPFNVYLVFVPSVISTHNGTNFSIEQAKLETSFRDINPNNGDVFLQKSFEILRQYPRDVVKVIALNSATFFTHDGILTFLMAAYIKPEIFLEKPATVMFLESPREFLDVVWEYMWGSMGLVLLGRVFWVLVTLLFFVGLIVCWRARLYSTPFVFSALMVFYFMGTTWINGITVNARFRMPIDGIFLAIACSGVYAIYNYVQRRV